MFLFEKARILISLVHRLCGRNSCTCKTWGKSLEQHGLKQVWKQKMFPPSWLKQIIYDCCSLFLSNHAYRTLSLPCELACPHLNTLSSTLLETSWLTACKKPHFCEASPVEWLSRSMTGTCRENLGMFRSYNPASTRHWTPIIIHFSFGIANCQLLMAF